MLTAYFLVLTRLHDAESNAELTALTFPLWSAGKVNCLSQCAVLCTRSLSCHFCTLSTMQGRKCSNQPTCESMAALSHCSGYLQQGSEHNEEDSKQCATQYSEPQDTEGMQASQVIISSLNNTRWLYTARLLVPSLGLQPDSKSQVMRWQHLHPYRACAANLAPQCRHLVSCLPNPCSQCEMLQPFEYLLTRTAGTCSSAGSSCSHSERSHLFWQQPCLVGKLHY